MLIPSTVDRVPHHTPPELNRAIFRRTEDHAAYFAQRPEEIADRLRRLDREWDTERVLESLAGTLGATGALLALTTGRRRWLALPAVVGAFLAHHAVRGWCPPLAALRRLGVRTQHEIERERYALKALRGDFEGACVMGGPRGRQASARAMAAVVAR
ncbi:MAG TPA: DUF2892 domain-containing protein [Phycisphaerales bacterium]|nr:DUF2892 domain-containing protein [Phycisphaerales bacterium]